MTDTLLRLESYPFDSRFDGYDDDGWPVYDRAVGSSLTRMIYRQFFSDGLFKREGSYFWIEPADEGLAVVIKPGAAIIRGGMGGTLEDTTLKLDEASPIGKTPYAIMVRIDEDIEFRSLYFRCVSGSASANPVPPAPEETGNAKELRLGYVILPSGSTDMSEAVIVNEQGLDVCPFAAPFIKIDVSRIISKLYEDARSLLTKIREDFAHTKDEINTAFYNWFEHLQDELNDNQAANLQGQIDALKYWYVDGDALYVPQTAAMIDGDTLILPPYDTEGN